MKYTVNEVYTPEDTDLDRKRFQTEFESKSTDLFELAVQARTACHPSDSRTEETIANIRKALVNDDVLEQLEGQDHTFFDFLMFGNNGEWEISVEALLPSATPS